MLRTIIPRAQYNFSINTHLLSTYSVPGNLVGPKWASIKPICFLVVSFLYYLPSVLVKWPVTPREDIQKMSSGQGRFPQRNIFKVTCKGVSDSSVYHKTDHSPLQLFYQETVYFCTPGIELALLLALTKL